MPGAAVAIRHLSRLGLWRAPLSTRQPQTDARCLAIVVSHSPAKDGQDVAARQHPVGWFERRSLML